MQLAEQYWRSEEVLRRSSVLRRRARELDGEIAPSVVDYQATIYDSPEVAQRMRRYVKETDNVVADVVAEVAQVYTIPPRRRLASGTEEQKAAFLELVRETTADVSAPRWALHSLYSGPVLVLPSVGKDDLGVHRLRLLHYLAYRWTPSSYRADFYPDEIAVMDFDGDPKLGALKRVMVCDKQGWHWFDGHMNPGRAPVEHGLGFVPAAIFRASDAQDDYWGEDLGRRAHDATVDAGFQGAELRHVRKTQNRRQLAILGAEGAPKRQTLDPELTLELGPESDIRGLDMVTGPREFLDHIESIRAAVYSAYGVTGSDLKLMSGRAVGVTLARRGLLRAEQIRWMSRAEERLWKCALAVVAATPEHRFSALFKDWRDLDVLIEFPDISLIEDPSQREAVYKPRAARGASDPVSELMVDNPHLTREEAHAKVMEAIAVQAEVSDFQARRMSASPDRAEGYQTESQKTGRQGGIESGERRRNDD